MYIEIVPKGMEMSEKLAWREVNRLIERLTLHEQAVLVERLARRLAQEIAPARKPTRGLEGQVST